MSRNSGQSQGSFPKMTLGTPFPGVPAGNGPWSESSSVKGSALAVSRRWRKRSVDQMGFELGVTDGDWCKRLCLSLHCQPINCLVTSIYAPPGSRCAICVEWAVDHFGLGLT